MSRRLLAVAPLLALGLADSAQAAYIATLEYVTPAATVSITDTIEVRLRLTLDPSSDPLALTGIPFSDPPFGVPPGNYPTEFQASDGGESAQTYTGTFTELTAVFLNTYFECSGTFTSNCTGGPPYTFHFNLSGPDSINFLTDLTLDPGESREYVFGSFTPDGGAAPPGTYYFYNTGISLNFRGTAQTEEPVLDENGDPVPVLDEYGDPVYDDDGNPVYETTIRTFTDAEGEINLAATGCRGLANPDCTDAFMREAVVPLPAAGWLLLTAFGAVAAGVRRRR
jgi:hypothetical protein